MCTSFIINVRDVQQIAEAQIGEEIADIVEFQAQVGGHKANKKAGRIQVWQHLSDWQLANRFQMIDLSCFRRAPGGVGSMSQSLRVQDGGRSQHTARAERGASNVHSSGSSGSVARTFTRCDWIEGASA